MGNSFIVDYWNSQAEHFGSSYAASWEDKYMIDLEIKTIAEYIKDGDFVLDAGCSNGHATFEQMRLHKLSCMVGIDIADKMIEKANEKALDIELNLTCIDFSSLYYLGSRFIRNLIVDNKYDGYGSELHDMFYKLEVNNQGVGFGIQQAYVISV